MTAGERILLIEDDRLMARAVTRTLHGYTVVVAHTAAEGLARLEEADLFGLVLCDLTLPDRTGVALYEDARARARVTPSRFMFMTGLASDPQLAALRAREPIALFEKPFSPDALRRAVALALTPRTQPQ